jgi:hypothetical protein
MHSRCWQNPVMTFTVGRRSSGDVTWRRPDGEPLDPWIRTHTRLGARILAPAPRSQVICGTVAEWESWTGLVFPDSGDYVIPEGLSTLHVDRDADRCTYVEPNVWVQHK